MTQSMEWVEAIEAGTLLPLAENDLNSSLRDPMACLVAEEGIDRGQFLAGLKLVAPKPLEFRPQGLREKHVGRPPALGDLGAKPNPRSSIAVREVHIT
jgi:hypothetical protein